MGQRFKADIDKGQFDNKYKKGLKCICFGIEDKTFMKIKQICYKYFKINDDPCIEWQ